MLVIGGILYRHRWKLRYIYYVMKIRFRIHQPQDKNQYKYDAFMSYASEDRDFTINDVIAKLQNDYGFNLCIHEADFTPGKLIAENTVLAVQQSRRTVLILSPNYLASKWCMYEFNMAKMESVHSRTGDRVIFIIMLEHVNPRDIPIGMMDIIQNDCYIKYPHEEEGRTMFWNKIKEAIRE